MRRRDRRAFWAAVQRAAGNEPGSVYANKLPAIWGLRAIRDFEKANGIAFNPRDAAHRARVHHMGRARVHLAYMGAQLAHVSCLGETLAVCSGRAGG